MKINTFLAAITGATLLLLTACNSNDENNTEPQKPTQTVQFSFTNEDFGADETLTRTNETTTSQIIDMGDSEAEITVENEPAVKTRGTQTPANGHYTIRAYQSGTLKGEIKGTFSGGTFTPDGGTTNNMLLPHGTYDFIAFNDDVIPSGNNLTVARNKAGTAMMSTTTVVINQDPIQLVSFTMKHIGCRLRTQFVCQKHIPENITATLDVTDINGVPTSMAYNTVTKVYTTTNGAMASIANNSPASTEVKYLASAYGRNYSYTSTSDYQYFLPTTNIKALKLSFSAGTIFWKPLSGTIPQLHSALLEMQSGKSYLIKIKLKPNYTYLMSDGTTGFFKQTTYGGGSKTPIAVVVDADQHIALSLKDAIPGTTMNWCRGAQQTIQTNVIMVPPTQALTTHARSGREETWNPLYSTGSIGVKATNLSFIAHVTAADYSPGLVYTGTPALVSYLPSYHDWIVVFSKLGFGDASAVTTAPKSYNWYGYLASSSYLNVGGNGGDEWFWTSSEITPSAVGTLGLFGAGMAWDSASKGYGCSVRAFIAY